MLIEKQKNKIEFGGKDFPITFKTINMDSTKQVSKSIITMKGAERNMPCPCGSGKKYKKCCGKLC